MDMDMDAFEQSSRLKVRFDYKGQCSDEDLWDLKVQELDSMYKKLNCCLKKENEDSLLNEKSNNSKILELKIKIIKHIVSVKLKEQKANELKAINSEKKKHILNLIAEKQNEHLKSLDIEELKKLVNTL